MLGILFLSITILLWTTVGLHIAKRGLRVSNLSGLCTRCETSSEMRASWKPFARFDRKLSPVPSRMGAVVRAVIFGPIRLLTAFSLVIISAVAATVLPKAGVVAVARWVSRSILYAFGIRLRVEGIRANAHDAPLMVANHVSPTDILALLSLGGCFVAKEAVRDLPGIGKTATAIGCIYVGRDSAESRSAAKEAITARLKEKMAAPRSQDCNQLVVFPEGTTTNGYGVIEFRRGAFEANVPFQPARIEYSNLQYSMAMVGVLDHACYMCCLPGCDLTVHYLPVIRPPAEMSPEDQANLSRDAILAGTALERYGMQSHREEKELVKFLACMKSPIETKKST